MELICQNCGYYSEGRDGDYGGGVFHMECSHPVINGPARRHSKYSIEELCYFPFAPAPDCFEPNFELYPERFFKGDIEDYDFDYYRWASTAELWDGDHISLINPSNLRLEKQ